MPKVSKLETKKIINFQTGKTVIECESTTMNIGSEPAFIKLYLGNIMYLSDIPPHLSAVMMCILKKVPYFDDEEPSIVLNKNVKQNIANTLGMSYQSVANSIVKLVKGQLLYHIGSQRSASYLINPHIFGKGHWKDVRKLQLHVDFEPNQTTFWTEVSCADVPKDERGVVEDMLFLQKKQKERKAKKIAHQNKEYEELKAQIRKELEEEMKRAE